MKDLLLCVHVVIETLKLEISHCHLADYIKEFYLSACRTCSTIILPHSINQIIFWSLLSLSLSCLSSQLIILSGVGIFACEVSGYLVLRSSLIALLNCSWQWYHRGGHREDCQSPMAESGWFDWQVQEKVRTSEGKILIWDLLSRVILSVHAEERLLRSRSKKVEEWDMRALGKRKSPPMT